MATLEQLQLELQALTLRIQQFESEHAIFQHWNNSRRGVEGAPGKQGIPGQSITGPPGQSITGAPGKDANIAECVAAAQAAMERELAAFRAALSGAITQELKTSGVVDEAGKAILIPGPAGQNSVVPGPAGASIVGPAGKDAAPAKDGVDGRNGLDAVVRIGSVVSGITAAITVRETTDGQVLDFVLPRGWSGPIGSTGPAGASIVGPAGKDAAPAKDGRDAVVVIGNVSEGDSAAASIRVENGVNYIDLVLPRGHRGEAGAASQVAGPQGVPGTPADLTPLEALQADINKQVSTISMQLENRFRRIAKDDIAAALRGHLVESHN